MLRIDYLSVPGLPALSFEVAARECLAVEGPSGSGKTRLLRAIADLDPADGYIFLDGIERREMAAPAVAPARALCVRRARLVGGHGAPALSPHRQARPAPVGAGARLGLLDRPIAELSTGERQRLGLIRALADEPQVLLLDEPTSSLDAATTALAEELIKFQLLAGRAVILVSHDAGQIERLAHGRLLLAGDHAAADQQRSAAA